MNKELLIEPEEDIKCEEFNELIFENKKIITKSIEKTQFIKCKLLSNTFENVYFDNIEFTDCDLTNSKFIDCDFRNTTFNNCKLLGVNISTNRITNLHIDNSVCKYINIIDTKTKNMKIDNCNFLESNFYNVTLEKSMFSNVDFHKTEFTETYLSGIDLSTCKIEDIKSSPKCIKGVIIDSSQAYILVNILGVKVI